MGVINLLRSGKGPMDGWVARAYDRGVQAVFREIFPTLVEDLLDEMRGVGRALDVGCGPGQFTIFYPRVFAKAMSPGEARGVFQRSPFGAPTKERMFLDGVFWLFEATKETA
jgi:SAM-dependent methyltransferase